LLRDLSIIIVMHQRQLFARSAATVLGVGGIVVALIWGYSDIRVEMTSVPDIVHSRILEAAVAGGIVCLFLYAAFGLLAGPRLALLTWPAVFLGLGWIYITEALGPPTASDRNSVGTWWAVGVMFVVFGAAVLVPLLVLAKGRRMLWSDGTDGPTIDILMRRGWRNGRMRRGWQDRQPRNIDELFAGLAGQRPQTPGAVRAAQVYSVVLHLAVIAAAFWLGAASFTWLTR
jgi:hypothetical protein